MFGTLAAWPEHKLGEEFNRILVTFVGKKKPNFSSAPVAMTTWRASRHEWKNGSNLYKCLPFCLRLPTFDQNSALNIYVSK